MLNILRLALGLKVPVGREAMEQEGSEGNGQAALAKIEQQQSQLQSS
jgi:hypothetical protein